MVSYIHINLINAIVNIYIYITYCIYKRDLTLCLNVGSSCHFFLSVFFRSSCSQVFFKIGRKACNFIKKTLQHRCFPVNIEKFLRKAFFFYRTPLVTFSVFSSVVNGEYPFWFPELWKALKTVILVKKVMPFMIKI